MGIATIRASQIRRKLTEVIVQMCKTCGARLTANSSGICDACA